MVLEEAASGEEPTPSAFSEEAIPTSDIDPYASGNANPPFSSTRDSSYIRVDQKGAEPIYIHINNIPHPLLFGPSTAAMAKAVNQNCELAGQVLQRPVNREEAEAFAFHLGRGLRIGSYGAPIGIALGAVQAYRTNGESYRFPGWTPMREGGRYSPDRFLWLRGQLARSAWQTSRVAAYCSAGVIFGQMFFGTYALSASLAARFRDPRLKSFTEALHKRQQEKGGLPRPRQEDQSDGAKAGETYEMARQRRGVQRQAGTQQQERKSPVDDASPTGGAFEQDVMQDTGLMNDSQVQEYNYSRQQEQRRTEARTENEVTRREASQQQRAPSTSETTSSTPRRETPRTGGSSWDRIRQNAMGGSKNERASPSSTSSGGDSFSFSQGDEDRQLAKSEAQKEFDNRIAKERAGKDFDDGSGRRGRW
jgi:hypothetical protein